MTLRHIIGIFLLLLAGLSANSQDCSGGLTVALQGSGNGFPVVLTVANAGDDQNVCNELTTTLTANIPSMGTGHWEIVSGPGSVFFDDATAASTSMNVSIAGDYTLSWVIAEGDCKNEDWLVLHFYELSNLANAGPDMDVCETLTASLNSINPAPNTGTWEYVSGPGFLSFADENAFNTSATASEYGVYTLAWHVSYGPCISSDTLVIDFCTPALALTTQILSGELYSFPGDTVTIAYTVTNTSKFALQGPFTVTDDKVSGIPQINGSLAPGQSATVTGIYIALVSDFPPLSVTTTSYASTDYNGMTIVSTNVETTAFANAADLSLNVEVDDPTPNVGQQVTFTSTLTNQGPYDATGVSLEILVGSGYDNITDISYGGVYNGGAGRINYTGARGLRVLQGTIVWTDLTIVVGDTLRLTFKATVNPPGPGVNYVNCAMVTSSTQFDPNSTPGDDDPMEDDVDEAQVFPPVSDLAGNIRQISNENLPLPNDPSSVYDLIPVSPGIITAGEFIYWQLRLDNLGPDTSMNVVVTSAVPPSLQQKEFSLDYGNTWYSWPANNTLTIPDFPNVPNNINVILRAKVPSAAAPGTVTNQFSVFSLETYDPYLTNNMASVSSAIIQNADLEVTIQQLRLQLMPGDTIEYLLTVTNYGPSDAANVVLTSPIDPALISGAKYSLNGGAFTTIWPGSLSLGTLVQDAQAVVRIKGIIIDKTPLPNVNPLVQTASVTTTTTESNPPNNSHSLETWLFETADVSVVKTGPANAYAGDTVTYTIVLTNHNNTFTAQDVVMQDLLNAAVFENGQFSANDGLSWSTWTGSAQTLDLAPMQSVTYKVRARIRPGISGGQYGNTASVSSATNDEDLTDNQSTWSVQVQVAANLSVVKSLATPPSSVMTGSPIEYAITYTNHGPSTATNVMIADIIPAGISGPVTYSLCGSPFASWPGSVTVGTMAPGTTCTLSIKGTVTPTFQGSQIVNTASISGSTTDLLISNNSSMHTAQVIRPGISLNKTASNKVNAKLGETITYTYAVTNTGNATMTAVSVADIHNGMGQLSAITPASVASLAPGQQAVFTATYIVTLDDINRKTNITNTATATAMFGNAAYTSTDTESVDVEELVKIGDFVWHDVNGDGQQNQGEPVMSGVQINLFTNTGEYIATRYSDAQGRYLFDNMSHGDYYMQFLPPAGYQPTFIDLGNDVSDSDVDSLNGPNTTAVFNVPSGGIRTNIDAGFYQCVQIGDLVWYDINKNDRWDSNENGINGLEVKLWRKHVGEWQPWRSQLTHLKPGSPSSDGYFSFCEAPGQYYLEVIMPPQGLVRARPDIGTNEEIDSDITNGNGLSTTNTFVVSSGQTKTDLGAGFYPMAVAGNLVWLDENLNGLQDSAEQRMENVKVEAILQATGEVVHTVYTDAEGTYQIDYLEKQNYYLRFTPPAGYAPTMPRLGQDSIDSDVDHTFGANTTRAFSMLPDVTYDNIDMGLIYGVLPVDWLDVNVRRENNVHMVYWRTAREVNVSHYEVERRLEHEPEFYVIPGKVKAHGNSTAILDYNHADKDVNAVGTYIYRVKQVDYDGQYTYSRWVKVSHSGEPLVDLYPNPARNDASVQVILPYEASLGIELYDQTSRLVKVVRKPQMQDQGDWLFTIDLQDVVPGTYNVVVTIGTEVTQRKLIRVK